jgi:hypothetical protein
MIRVIKKSLKFILFLLVGLLLLVVFYINVRLYYSPTFIKKNKVEINEDVLNQLRYLEDYLHDEGGRIAQAKYPEGFVFVNVLYGLTWCDFIANMPTEHPLRKKGLNEIDSVLQQLNSDYAKMWFPTKLNPINGIFYAGWKNYLLAKKISIQQPSEWVENDTLELSQQCDQIYTAFKSSNQTYLESYVEGVWPADNIVAIASLSLSDRVSIKSKYSNFISKWIKNVKMKLDPQTGLIPHEVIYKTNEIKEGARGSSQSLMLIFLLEIDSVFAKEQFTLYEQLFFAYRFGLPGVREYPMGITGGEDVDSGPVLLEIGGAASLVGQRTMALYKAIKKTIGLRNSIESFGVAYTNGGQKKYVFGLEPIADAFIAWANVINIQKEEKQTANWRWTFQCLSLTLFMIAVIIIIIKITKRRQPVSK